MKRLARTEDERNKGRAPHGARGLKPRVISLIGFLAMSRPTRGAWIETISDRWSTSALMCRAPHGARGLKPFFYLSLSLQSEVAPHTGRVD